MDLPEQPTVWPPAPSIAPPEPAKVERPKLIVPEWISYWCSWGMLFVSVSYVARGFCNALHVHRPLWASFLAAVAFSFVSGGLLTLVKYWLRRKQG